ncbi:hypothetical protein L2735_10990 [Shewanella olleyana]|uniref:hypothetical protein n=1 Tax=Shewanella olleyana TaxID=135626 RepID=UPI00200CE8B2|nr:hypothetical protein [Shewanella olleyana]MCL1067330.1 hypothetical protein [Shewanella olleyana]
MKTNFILLFLSLISVSAMLSNQVHAEGVEFGIDLGWDSKYISEGRNNLADGGVYLGAASVSSGDFTSYAAVVRGDSEHYTEWNFGLEYALNLHDNLETIVGYQRLEFYGDERGSDNEFFAEIAYTGVDWLIPSVAYTYATEAGGYFVEVSLHSPWQLTEQFSITPYITQGFDFQYATEEHDGANHFQMGVEASYALSSNMAISAHFSHVIAMADIKKEAEMDGYTGSLDESYGGIYLSWSF